MKQYIFTVRELVELMSSMRSEEDEEECAVMELEVERRLMVTGHKTL